MHAQASKVLVISVRAWATGAFPEAKWFTNKNAAQNSPATRGMSSSSRKSTPKVNRKTSKLSSVDARVSHTGVGHRAFARRRFKWGRCCENEAESRDATSREGAVPRQFQDFVTGAINAAIEIVIIFQVYYLMSTIQAWWFWVLQKSCTSGKVAKNLNLRTWSEIKVTERRFLRKVSFVIIVVLAYYLRSYYYQ